MQPFNDIIAAHTDEDEEHVDLKAILDEAAEEMGAVPTISGTVALQLFDAHVTYALHMLGGLLLQTADEVGALPDGFEAGYESLVTALEFDKFRRLYEYKRLSTEKRIEVPGQTSIPIPE